MNNQKILQTTGVLASWRQSKLRDFGFLVGLCAGLVGCGSKKEEVLPLNSKVALGAALFTDNNLSRERNQSCASCHNPAVGFADDRINTASRDSGHGLQAGAGSMGDDQISIGDRNAPMAAYAAFSPPFHLASRPRVASQQSSGIAAYEGFLGGQFWDGREDDLQGQAAGPLLNPLEMNMPNKAAVIARLQENDDYLASFQHLYGADIFINVDAAYDALTESIAQFESSPEFYPFDSKYDRSLSGEFEYSPAAKASLGKALFFSSDLTCAACHQLRPIGAKGEIFTSFEYHNIGVPENTHLREINGMSALDIGLLNNPKVSSLAARGKFKVPSLRNVAITAPYMHNGIFNQLATVVRFYQHAKEKAQGHSSSHNPETGLPWGAAEVEDNIAMDLLGANDINLEEAEVEAMVCFLMSLTDHRYETLLDPTHIEYCGL